MPIGFNPEDMQKLDAVVATRRRVKQGDNLFGNGDSFTSLFAIRTGFFKTWVSTADGREQVTGFQMAGNSTGGVESHWSSSPLYHPTVAPGPACRGTPGQVERRSSVD